MGEYDENRRGFDSFKWIRVRPIGAMVGFGVSTDWLSRNPWTFDGECRPYIGVTREAKGSNLLWICVWLGPVVIQVAKKKADQRR